MPITKAEAQGVTRAFVRDYPGALELAYKFREDAAELLMAGATVVGVGSAVYARGVTALGQLRDELAQFMAAEGFAHAADLVGLAHARARGTDA